MWAAASGSPIPNSSASRPETRWMVGMPHRDVQRDKQDNACRKPTRRVGEVMQMSVAGRYAISDFGPPTFACRARVLQATTVRHVKISVHRCGISRFISSGIIDEQSLFGSKTQMYLMLSVHTLPMPPVRSPSIDSEHLSSQPNRKK